MSATTPATAQLDLWSRSALSTAQPITGRTHGEAYRAAVTCPGCAGTGNSRLCCTRTDCTQCNYTRALGFHSTCTICTGRGTLTA